MLKKRDLPSTAPLPPQEWPDFAVGYLWMESIGKWSLLCHGTQVDTDEIVVTQNNIGEWMPVYYPCEKCKGKGYAVRRPTDDDLYFDETASVKLTDCSKCAGTKYDRSKARRKESADG